jgi:hypothetical protein
MVKKTKNKKKKHVIYGYTDASTKIEKIMVERKIPLFKDHIWDVSFNVNLYTDKPSGMIVPQDKKIKITIEEVK